LIYSCQLLVSSKNHCSIPKVNSVRTPIFNTISGTTFFSEQVVLILTIRALRLKRIVCSQLLLESGSPKTYAKTRRYSSAFPSYFCSRGVNLSQRAYAERQTAPGPHGYRHSNASWPAGQAPVPGPPRGGVGGGWAWKHHPAPHGPRREIHFSEQKQTASGPCCENRRGARQPRHLLIPASSQRLGQNSQLHQAASVLS